MHHPIPRRQWLAAMIATGATWPLLSRAATPYPNGPITLVVPFSAGGQFDGVARLVSKAMSAELGQTIVVENIGGAGGNIAAARVARAKPDGQTLLMYGGNFAVARSLYKKLDYDPLEDFAPISRVSIAPHVIMVSPKLGVSSFAQLRERAKGAQLSYGSPGVGTSMHLAFEMVKDHFKLDVLHVPYRGGANVMTDLAGGQIELGIIAVGPALEFIRNGTVVPLAVTSAVRSPALPQVPSTAELGMKGFDAGSWSGFSVPRKTPPEIVKRLNAAVRAALESPEVKRQFDDQSFLSLAGTPEDMQRFVALEAQRYAPIIQKLNLAQ
ncbi:Bug family tripartite tricarboxylate transporter substrate binding protein [Hydrogenophaga sp. BPS33]|uniref:Bug family tripartite tricarboxylate transporter substrate binding protein n=1 Tax=Hydrogenophaga sp. BPS33 TaxID=2651974 RepID=UPI00131FB691|nr:tripartite tricarboxylate transporter substrate-binding protein [Hydrogenophaga sp. BPS33]QHE83924.1 tripartite tricarboxylate transporter substrate binding protein [Hydrogenophaga sp. BPS33]